MNNLGVVVFALAIFASGCCASAPAKPVVNTCSKGRTIIVVRHAEKASSDKDTSLSERGQARAKAISNMLANAGVTRLIATQYKRTQETLMPLAERTSIKIDVQDASKTKDLIAELQRAPEGSTTVVATHSNVVPLLVRELTASKLRGVEGDALAEDDFSRVVVLSQPCGAPAPSVVEMSSD